MDNLAEKHFGDSNLGYPGFDIALRQISEKIGIALISQSDIKNHKWEVLLNTMDIRPAITDCHVMASIITEISGVSYEPAALDMFEALHNLY